MITIANKPNDLNNSEIIVCDDYYDIKDESKQNIERYFNYYKLFFSFILDSTYYNRMILKIHEGNIEKNFINLGKIKGRYSYNGIIYCGEYFDKRLIGKKIRKSFKKEMMLDQLFNILTEKNGINKYFIRIDIRIIEYLNNLNVNELSEYYIGKK